MPAVQGSSTGIVTMPAIVVDAHPVHLGQIIFLNADGAAKGHLPQELARGEVLDHELVGPDLIHPGRNGSHIHGREAALVQHLVPQPVVHDAHLRLLAACICTVFFYSSITKTDQFQALDEIHDGAFMPLCSSWPVVHAMTSYPDASLTRKRAHHCQALNSWPQTVHPKSSAAHIA